MIRWRIQPALCLIIGLMVLGLAGCGNANTPPESLVAQALSLQVQQNQSTLWQQLSPQSQVTPTLSVSQVKVRRTRPVQVASTLAYESTGTYRYQIRYPDRRRFDQSRVPFTVVLQPIPDSVESDWQVLQTVTGAAGDLTWFWQPLSGNV